MNGAFARQHLPGERALGKRLLLGGGVPAEIVGVVGDIRQVALAEPARPTMYVHNLQNARVKTTIVVRTEGDPAGLANAVRDAIWAIDPLQPITAVFTLDEATSRTLTPAAPSDPGPLAPCAHRPVLHAGEAGVPAT